MRKISAYVFTPVVGYISYSIAVILNSILAEDWSSSIPGLGLFIFGNMAAIVGMAKFTSWLTPSDNLPYIVSVLLYICYTIWGMYLNPQFTILYYLIILLTGFGALVYSQHEMKTKNISDEDDSCENTISVDSNSQTKLPWPKYESGPKDKRQQNDDSDNNIKIVLLLSMLLVGFFIYQFLNEKDNNNHNKPSAEKSKPNEIPNNPNQINNLNANLNVLADNRPNRTELNASMNESSDPNEFILAFLRYINAKNFDKAYLMTLNPKWEPKDSFSTQGIWGGFRALEDIVIDSDVGYSSGFGDKVLRVKYTAYGVNAAYPQKYEWDYHLKKIDYKWQIIKMTLPKITDYKLGNINSPLDAVNLFFRSLEQGDFSVAFALTRNPEWKKFSIFIQSWGTISDLKVYEIKEDIGTLSPSFNVKYYSNNAKTGLSGIFIYNFQLEDINNVWRITKVIKLYN
ncbi:MAG TPA: hypothetical protein PKM27_03325 [Saprospiraceae bacterium]|nr:hypothetical protein [Saprospiraceae bacterium]HNT20562.1 hypothetical protein [Saprospiraceae bacterium]